MSDDKKKPEAEGVDASAPVVTDKKEQPKAAVPSISDQVKELVGKAAADADARGAGDNSPERRLLRAIGALGENKDKSAKPAKEGKPPEWHPNGRGGVASRLALLMTHYRAPLSWREDQLTESAKIWRKIMARAEPNEDEPAPREVVDAMADDHNTPRALAAIHAMAGQKKGRQVYAGMRFLGLLPLDGEKAPVITAEDRK